jgi:hypothetical protein
MLTLHVVICFIGLLAGAFVLLALWKGSREPTWDAVLLASSCPRRLALLRPTQRG